MDRDPGIPPGGAGVPGIPPGGAERGTRLEVVVGVGRSRLPGGLGGRGEAVRLGVVRVEVVRVGVERVGVAKSGLLEGEVGGLGAVASALCVSMCMCVCVCVCCMCVCFIQTRSNFLADRLQ